MLIGYARSSSIEQVAGIEAQIRDLQAAGCEKVFAEQVSSVDMAARQQLSMLLDYARDGDTVVITDLSRLARSVSHLLSTLDRLAAKGTQLRILNMGIDTGTPTGKLMLTILGGISEWEREVMLERQREGVAKAKLEGKYKGRKPTARAKAEDVNRLRAEGIGPTEIAARLGIGRASVYRILSPK
ncbi:recombinase family protein [Magnetospirillum moscoviense]|uniref:DNA invertase n=1 Tax=Magnetospirillum moscoviense TaxID=1437059 RepID=A0A178MBX5_9PROT|nr:recombinase family protein [Magnetospirillum moscoviense]OAN46301.1 DNA invertase [Magnetospirillum moscoviense]